MLPRALIAVLVTVLLTGLGPGSGQGAATRDPNVAALQVGLRAQGVYGGSVDGLAGPATIAAVRNVGGDGLFGTRTRARLGALGRHSLGSRLVASGAVGWDAAALQFMLAWHGFPSATVDGAFGDHSVRALEKFERWAGLPADGVAGPAVIAALKQPPPTCPIALYPPLSTPYTDRFGPRGNRFHTGLDFPAAPGTPVAAAAPGRVSWSGPMAGGWGTVVMIEHGGGVQTLYAHLSRAIAPVDTRVVAGRTVGLVGATGDASGSHVHFEVRLRGAALDPLTGLR
jgi:Peptidase family M23/Putative peptidoglycan binding domain